MLLLISVVLDKSGDWDAHGWVVWVGMRIACLDAQRFLSFIGFKRDGGGVLREHVAMFVVNGKSHVQKIIAILFLFVKRVDKPFAETPHSGILADGEITCGIVQRATGGAGDADDEFAVWIGLQIGILQDADASAPLREIRLQIVAEIVETEHDKKKVWLLYVPHGQVFGIIDVPCEKVLRGRLPSFAVVEDEYLLVVVVLQIAFLRIFEVARGFVETRQDIVETATGIVRLEAFRSGLEEALPGDCPELCRAPIAEIAN